MKISPEEIWINLAIVMKISKSSLNTEIIYSVLKNDAVDARLYKCVRVSILLTHGKHLHDHIISLRGEI